MSGKKNQGKSLKSPQKKRTDDPVAIVGIGASAGGLEAFSKLLNNLPVDTGMAFIFVQHLEPTHESKLSEIFSKFTGMPVTQVTKRTRVIGNKVYVIPPGKYLRIEKGYIILSEREKTDGLYLPINFFFKSLAVEEKNKAIAIILSGTASDGTEGLKFIKAEGGLTFAQEESSAKYPGMPLSAIDSGNVDIVLSPEKIAKELVRIGSHPYIAFSRPKEKENREEADDAYSRIFQKLRSTTGIDFSNYKLSTIRRRIARRMVLKKINTIEEYAELVKESKTEATELYHELLINVTDFFRDREVFEMLNKKVLPEISKNMTPDNSLRIWIPGCATGEEAYSIAISIFEFMDQKSLKGSIQIFATDISESALEKARLGIYREASVKNLNTDIVTKYFTKINGTYQISKAVRDVCIFAKQDITGDPPFSRIDLISCRNLLIYFSSELQKKIINVFHYALNPGGFLLLGTSESVGGFDELFFLNDRRYKLYSKKRTSSRLDFSFSFPSPAGKAAPGNLAVIPDKLDIQKEADKIVLNNYAPPGILINSAMEIIQFRGKISSYLEPSIGAASLNVYSMLKDIFNLDLHAAIRKVRQTNSPFVIKNIRYDYNGSTRIIDLEVIPVKSIRENLEYSYLILFHEKYRETKADSVNKTQKGKKNKVYSDSDRLQKELMEAKESLKAIVEEREAANEELRSALEELQSSNEELQSTNEEMETAKEELQSTNEELITVNDELENRNDQLNELNNDLNNIFTSISIPIVMLGRDLRIRRFTPRAEKLWNLISGDVGRPIENINPGIIVPDLKKNIVDVLENFESKEMQVKDNEGTWYSMKIRPYRTTDNKVDGVVISLYDVDVMKKDYDAAIEGRNFAREVFSNVEGAFVVMDDKLRLIDATKTYFELFNIKPEDSIGKRIFDTGSGEWNELQIKKLFEEIIPDRKVLENFSYVLQKKNNEVKNILINTQVFRLPGIDNEYILMLIKENG